MKLASSPTRVSFWFQMSNAKIGYCETTKIIWKQNIWFVRPIFFHFFNFLSLLYIFIVSTLGPFWSPDQFWKKLKNANFDLMKFDLLIIPQNNGLYKTFFHLLSRLPGTWREARRMPSCLDPWWKSKRWERKRKLEALLLQTLPPIRDLHQALAPKVLDLDPTSLPMPKCKLTRPKPCGTIAHLIVMSSFVYKCFK